VVKDGVVRDYYDYYYYHYYYGMVWLQLQAVAMATGGRCLCSAPWVLGACALPVQCPLGAWRMRGGVEHHSPSNNTVPQDIGPASSCRSTARAWAVGACQKVHWKQAPS